MTEPARLPTPEALLEHRAWIRALARSLVGDENAVDDVEQRTWMTVMRTRRPVTSVKGWLRRVVRSAAFDARRADVRRQAREERAARPEAMPPTDHLVAEAEAQRAVAAAVTALPEPYRGTVLLRYFEGLTPTEIAARCGVPVETVKTRLKRALAILRVALDRDFGDRRAWALVLAPLARVRLPAPAGTGVAAAIETAAAGGAAMAVKTKVAVAAALVLVAAAGLVWTASRGGPDADRGGTVAATTTTSDAAPPARRGRAHERPEGPRFAVTGRVRSRQDGRPVAGARVASTAGDDVRGGASAERAFGDTAADGTFRVDGVAAGAVRVSAPRFRPATVDVAASDADAVVALGDVWLDAAESLVVVVLGPADAPIAGAEVALTRRTHEGAVATTDSYLFATVDPAARTTRLGSATTGADGTARFDGIAPGVHHVVAHARGFTAGIGPWVDVAPGCGETRTTVRLAPAHRVAGRVVTAAGDPAPDRFVDAGTAVWDERAFARTDADGRFVLDDVPAGDVTLSVGRARGRNPEIATVRVPDVSDVELRLPPMGAVVGTVTLADGTPVEGAEVGIETNWGWNARADARTVTDSQGRYRIDEIPAGSLQRFSVRHAGLFHVGPRLEIGELHDRRSGAPAGISARVPSGAELRLDATMAKGARLHGRVTGPDGPVGGAWVYLHLKPTKAGQEWETAVCDAQGRYAFDFLPPGPAAAVPLHPAYVHPDAPAELGTALGAGKVAPSLCFDLPEGGDVERDFTMVAATRVAGRVLGSAGSPVEGATVRCDAATYSSPPPLATTTDAAGTFVLAGVAGPGKTKLRVEAPGLVQADAPEIALEPAGRVDGVEVRMVPAPHVTGRVLDGDGAPVAGARVRVQLARWDGGPAPTAVAWTDASGAFDVAASRAAGRFAVTATAPGCEEAGAQVEVNAGGASVDLRLPRGVVVAGRVTLAGGAPVAGAAIVPRDGSKRLAWYYGDLLTRDPEVVRASTDDDGRFRVALPPGAWVLIVRARGLVDEVVTVTAPSSGDVAIAMRPAATLSGTLLGDDGKPAAGVVVVLDPGADVASERLSTPQFSPDLLRVGDHLLAHRTDGGGAFAFHGVPEGTYALVAVLPAATSQRYREVRFGPLRPSGSPHELTLAAPLSNALAGRVVDAGGVPYVDARVSLTLLPERGDGARDPLAARKAVRVDAEADGSFRLDGLTAASCTLQVFVLSDPDPKLAPNGSTIYRRSQRRAFHGLRPPRADLVLEMADGLRSTGRVLDDAGAPLAACVVTAQAADGDPCVVDVSAVTRADGTFELSGLEDVACRLVVRPADGRGRRVVASHALRGGADFGDVTATLEARIRGRVTDKAGAPVVDATVGVMPEGFGMVVTVKTAADGTFEISGLEPGKRYCVGVDRADGRPWWEGRAASDLPTFAAGATDVRLVRE